MTRAQKGSLIQPINKCILFVLNAEDKALNQDIRTYIAKGEKDE